MKEKKEKEKKEKKAKEKKVKEKKPKKINEKKMLVEQAGSFYKQEERKKNPLKKEAEKQRVTDVKTKKKLLAELNKQRKAKSKISKTVQDTIPYIADFDNGIFENKKNIYSVMVEFEDMNYHTSTIEEQEKVFLKYCAFLNQFSEDVSLQIFICNERTNQETLSSYLRIKSQNDGLDELRREYNEIVEEHIEKGLNDLILRKYVVISIKADDIVSATQNLNFMVTETIKGMMDIGVQAKKVKTKERLRILHDIFRPDYIGNFNMEYDKVKLYGISTKDFISPTSFKWARNHFEVGDRYARCIYIGNWASSISDKFVSELTRNNFDMLTSINIKPLEHGDALKTTRRQLLGMDSNKLEQQKKAMRSGFSPDMINRRLKEALEDAEELLEGLQKKNQKLFDTSLTIMLKAKTKEELDKQTKTIEVIAKRHVCEALKLDYMQEEAMKQVLPFAINTLPISRPFTTEAVAVLLPFNASDLFDKNGAFYGISRLSGNMIISNRKSLKNQNAFILGTPGAGKSMTAKWEMFLRRISSNDEIIIIDPQGEYAPLSDAVNGSVIRVYETSKTRINPLDLSLENNEDNPIASKKDFMYSFFEIVKNDGQAISGMEKSIISRCLSIVYKKYLSTKKEEDIPTLKDLYDCLLDQVEEEAQSLAGVLELHLDGIFSEPTNVDMENKFTIFDISKIGANLKALGLLTSLEFVWKRVLHNHAIGKRTWLYIDEIYLMFQNEYSDNYIYNLWKQARKYGCVTTGITQNVEDLLRSDNARTLLSNSEFLILLNQAYADRVAISEILRLSEDLSKYITDVQPGQGLFKAGATIIPFENKIPRESELYTLMTTNIDDKKEIAERKMKQLMSDKEKLEKEIKKLQAEVQKYEE